MYCKKNTKQIQLLFIPVNMTFLIHMNHFSSLHWRSFLATATISFKSNILGEGKPLSAPMGFTCQK